jgi:hypothetical protein
MKFIQQIFSSSATGKHSFSDKCVPKYNLGTREFILTALFALSALIARADAPAAPATPAPSAAPSAAVPATTFPASRYEVLWTKSPFAVATSDTVGEESPDYMLVGIANFDGISYASVLEAKPPQEHFLISSDKATRGMTLKSINHNHDGTETYAVVVKDGQSLTLKLQQAPALTGTETPGAMPMNAMPGSFAPQIPMPGSGTGSVRPFTRFHRPPIHLPNMPSAQPVPQPQGAAPPPPPPPQ